MKLKVFIDDFAFKAFINRRHPRHSAVVQAFEDFARLQVSLATSVLVETSVHEYVLTNISPTIARDFVGIMPQTHFTLLRPTPKDETFARQTLAKPTSITMLYADALHIAMLKRVGIDRALSTNPHFSQNGIAIIGN